MKLTFDELANVLAFCPRKVITNILSKKGTIWCFADQLLSDYKTLWTRVLDIRNNFLENPEEQSIPTDVEIIDMTIENNQDDSTLTKMKNSMLYDGRVESMLTISESEDLMESYQEVIITVPLCKILLECSYDEMVMYHLKARISYFMHNWLISEQRDLRINATSMSFGLPLEHMCLLIDCHYFDKILKIQLKKLKEGYDGTNTKRKVMLHQYAVKQHMLRRKGKFSPTISFHMMNMIHEFICSIMKENDRARMVKKSKRKILYDIYELMHRAIITSCIRKKRCYGCGRRDSDSDSDCYSYDKD